MIFTKLLSLFFVNFCMANYFKNMQCNFSVYFLNYFNHNKHFLQELSVNKNNYNEFDVITYGAAVQTHGEIVMVMLDVLRKFNSRNYSRELMTINLYLNNVSNTLDMIGKNDDGTFDYSDNTSNLIKGYTIMHLYIEEQLEKFIKKMCSNEPLDEEFVKFPYYNTCEDLHPKNLQYITEKLKNRIFDKNLHTNIERKNRKLNNNYVLNELISAINRCKYEEFHPKNLLFYDLMTNQHDFIENGVNQIKKYRIIKDGQPEHILDLLRFAPLIEKCSDGSTLTVLDVFRYVKYSFERLNIKCFEMLVQIAALHPIITFIQYYNSIFVNSTDVIGFRDHHEKAQIFYRNMINLGYTLIIHLEEFMDLKMFADFFINDIKDILSVVESLMIQFKQETISQFNEMSELLTKKTTKMLKVNKLDYSFEIVKLDENNIEIFYDKLIKNFDQIKAYTVELEKHKNSFFVVNNTMTKKFFAFHNSTHFLKSKIIDRMCEDNIYISLNKINSNYSDENFNDAIDSYDLSKINNEIKTVESQHDDEFENEENKLDNSKHFPDYMIDYLLFR
ncbi:uncharacterized protein LOC126907139 [Daktulosphaira vitifoliae]|uniref:uncharacterized protein LOC126907139 n=1 Tax=Daktulosphaira vitifoliae TaxID=58002 RepID=UPI0021A9ADB4|nr:uncharacterized protein LOC126907139 [Daktulosphaira vitifoliae]